MADIGKIVIDIEANDSGFTASINKAQSSVEKFGGAAKQHLGETTSGMEKLSGGAESLKKKMETLQTVLLGAGFIEVAHKALELSDTISDLSKGTDVSIPKILQLREAFEANGGSADGLGKIISKLNNYLYDAREGAQAAQEGLLKLGLSFSDMANMNTEEAMAKTIEKLAGMTDATERNALAFKVFGKEARNIGWEGIHADMANGTADFDRYGKALEDAGKAHDKLIAASEKLLIAFTNLLDKVGVIKFINDMSDSMDKFEKIVIVAGTAIATYFGAKAVIMIVEFTKAIYTIEKAILAVFAAEQLLEKGTIIGRIASVVVALVAAAGLYLGAEKLLEKAMEEPSAGGGRGKKGGPTAEELAAAGKTTTPKPNKAVTPYYAAEVAAIDQISVAYERATNSAGAKFRVDTALIGASQEQADKTHALNAITQQYNDQMEALNVKEKELALTSQSAGRDAKLGQIKKEKKEISELYDAAFAGAVKDFEAREKANKAFREYNLLIDEQINLSKQINEIRNGTELIGLAGIEKQHKQIEQAIRAEAQAEIDAENKRRGRDMGPMSADEEQVYRDRAKKREETLKAEASEANTEARKFSSGWKTAFNEYYDNATNAANQARDIFNSVMNSMDTMIDSFVKTGKLNFGDFTRSVIQDILKIQLKMAVLGLAKAAGFGDLFGIPMKAEGGPVMAGQATIVGERGPELFVPPTGGSIVPNNQLASGGGSTIHNHHYNINAVDAKSVAQLFAENRLTLFGNVEQARRELPMRTR